MIPANQEILFTRQRHEADRMGLHWDYRLVVGDKAYSFATKKEMPPVGKSIVLFEQPVHDRHYALSERVVIPAGSYGAGVTTLDWVRKAKIGEHSTPEKMTIHTKDGERYLLKKIDQSEWGDKAWLFRNLGSSDNKYLKRTQELDKTASLIGGAIATHLLQNIGVQKALSSKRTAQYLADSFTEGVHGVVNNSARAKATRIATGAALPDVAAAHKTMHEVGRAMSPTLKDATPRQRAAIRMMTQGKFDRVQRLGLHNDPVVQKVHGEMSKHVPLPPLDASLEKLKGAQSLWHDKDHPILSNILKNSGRGKVPKGDHFVPASATAKLPALGAATSALVDPAAGMLNGAKAMAVSKAVTQNKYGAKAVGMLQNQFVKNPIKAGLSNPTYNSKSLAHKAYQYGVNPVSANLKSTSSALASKL